MYPEAAKIVRLLEGARLVIDLDATSLGRQGLGLGYSAPGLAPGQGLDTVTAPGPGLGVSASSTAEAVAQSNSPVKPSSQVESVRAALARKWTALLIGSSLNKLQNKVSTSQQPLCQIIQTALNASLIPSCSLPQPYHNSTLTYPQPNITPP